MEIVNFSREENYVNIIELLGKEYYTILEIDSTGITNIESIYQQLITTLPIGIPLSGKVHWDAFLDSVWEGVAEAGLTKLALIWHGSKSILNESLSEFITIISVLDSVSVSLDNDPRCKFILFVLGNECNYK